MGIFVYGIEVKEVTKIYQCQSCFAEQEVTWVLCEPKDVVECDKCGKTSIFKEDYVKSGQHRSS